MKRCTKLLVLLLLIIFSITPMEAQQSDLPQYIKDNYTKAEYTIEMRDGVELYTAVYSPIDQSQTYPMLMKRTPYTSAPYGPDKFPRSLGPTTLYAREGFIFVYQDVRGRYMSGGTIRMQTPHIDDKQTDQDTDESSDTHDTIEWLLANVANHNGKVGQFGISWPGFYSAASMIDHHPALVAVSPQAPMSDLWYDDLFHNGATILNTSEAISRYFLHGHDAPHLPEDYGRAKAPVDEYQFFLELGNIKNLMDQYHDFDAAYLNIQAQHPNYDDFWRDRRILEHLKNVSPNVLTVGGWYDAEDLYGSFKVYQYIEEQNPGINNTAVFGPWRHGGWARSKGDKLGFIDFGSNTSEFYRENIELPFFNEHLKGKGDANLPEVYAFATGSNSWHRYDQWPPADMKEKVIYLGENGTLSFDVPTKGGKVYDEFISDPAHPVPYTNQIGARFSSVFAHYMVGDQRFASRRPDVLTYTSEVLTEDITFAGPMMANLWVSTSAADADWVVKVIDVHPDTASTPRDFPQGVVMGNFQQMVRSDVIRGRFRESMEVPKAFKKNRPTEVTFELQDLLHTFKAGHKIMIQVQSTWFPLVDRNPQKWVDNIYQAKESDFIKATHRVYRSSKYPSSLAIGVVQLKD